VVRQEVTNAGNPVDAIPGYYVTGELVLNNVDTTTTVATANWVNYPYAAQLLVTNKDTYLGREDVLVPGSKFALSECTAGDLGEAEEQSLGKYLLTGINLEQDLSVAGTHNSAPVLLPTTVHLWQCSPGFGYKVNLGNLGLAVLLDPQDPNLIAQGAPATGGRTWTYPAKVSNDPELGTVSFSLSGKNPSTLESSVKELGSIAGAKFELRDMTAGSNVWFAAVSVDGKVTFPAVPFGTWRLTQLSAPDYHNLMSPNPLEIGVTTGNTVGNLENARKITSVGGERG
jgi:hypothetical protein